MAMTHQEIEQREIVEAYLLERLSEADRQAFEEHFFACDACFAQVKDADRFVRGIRQAAQSGALPAASLEQRPALSQWFRPAFAFSCAAAAILLAISAWLALVQIPELRRERDTRQRLLDEARQRNTEIEHQLALNRLPTAEPNLPLLMLEATRAADVNNVLTIPLGAQLAALWIEPGPDARSTTFRLEVRSLADELILSIDGLMRNRYGALAVSLPVETLHNGIHRARLIGIDGAVISEYRFEIQGRGGTGR